MIKANAADSKRVTGIDREIAMRLNEFVKSGQLKVKVVAGDILSRAPRLSLRIGNEVQEFYGDADGPPLMEGAMSGVSHQISVKASESWWQSISGHSSDIPNPISSLTEKILSFRFHPHQTHKFTLCLNPLLGESNLFDWRILTVPQVNEIEKGWPYFFVKLSGRKCRSRKRKSYGS